jgi:hypothetical protein
MVQRGLGIGIRSALLRSNFFVGWVGSFFREKYDGVDLKESKKTVGGKGERAGRNEFVEVAKLGVFKSKKTIADSKMDKAAKRQRQIYLTDTTSNIIAKIEAKESEQDSEILFVQHTPSPSFTEQTGPKKNTPYPKHLLLDTPPK